MLTFAAAAIGSLVTIAAAVIVRLTLVPGEIRANDRRSGDRDEDLEAWICDRNVELIRELRQATDKLAADGLLDSGAYLYRISLTKERALHEWRDQERQARRDVAAIYDRENPLHRGWRRARGPQQHALATPVEVEEVLDAWRTPPATPGMRSSGTTGPEIDDPTARTLRGAIEAARNIADYV